MDRAQKKAFVEDLGASVKEAEIVILAHYKGLTVADISKLRSKMRAAGAGFKVAKNRLTKRAFEGTQFAPLSDKLKGPVALAYAKEPAAAAKALVEFAKDNENLVLLGGAFGSNVLDAQGLVQLSKLPSLDELRGKIIGLLQAPATKIAAVLAAPGGQVARVVGAYSRKS